MVTPHFVLQRPQRPSARHFAQSARSILRYLYVRLRPQSQIAACAFVTGPHNGNSRWFPQHAPTPQATLVACPTQNNSPGRQKKPQIAMSAR